MAKKKRPRAIGKTSASLPKGVRLLRTLRGHQGFVGRIAWSPDGRFLASPSVDKTIRLWDAATGECLRIITSVQSQDSRLHESKEPPPAEIRPPGVGPDDFRAVAFDSTGRMLASSIGGTIELWATSSGQRIRSFNQSNKMGLGLAFHPTSHQLALHGDDQTIELWDTSTGQVVRSLDGRKTTGARRGQIKTEGQGGWRSLAFDRTGRMIAASRADLYVQLFDVESGTMLRTFDATQGVIVSVAFDPRGLTVACVGGYQTVDLLDVTAGQHRRSLEGHTGNVSCVAFAPDGHLLASKGSSDDETVRLWRSDNGACVGVIAEPSCGHPLPGIAFHPTRPYLATVGSDREGSASQNDWLIHIWELDPDILLAKARVPSVTYTSAKVVLVGDSGVGKTGLGWRLAHGAFKEHASTHGQQFWALDQLNTRRLDGTQCEAVLWDLAGQPDYRLIHALFLDDADLALVLFDPTDSRDPLHGVEFWLKQFEAGSISDKSGRKTTPTILVAARADRGTARLTTDELEAFCRQRGIGGYFSTSAKEGDGVPELIECMQALISWEAKPATVTTATFKRVKDYVLRLKESQEEKQVIVNPQELRLRLQATDANWQFTDTEMMTAVGHLENHGYVKMLRTSKGEKRVLLAPELLNNLAASFILEARRNTKGLGSLEERRLLAGEYAFRELEGVSKDECDILLDSAALLFLEHNVCFRETDPLTSQSYLVFPDLINLKKPALDDEQPTEDGVSYTVTGSVENVYASLVVLLGYTHTFTRTDQWRNHARYEVGDSQVCGFRQDAERDGELDFVLYFGTNLGGPVRMLLQSLFESFLARRNLTVFRYDPVVCNSCGASLERAVVRAKSREGKLFAFCSDCGEKLQLPKHNEAIQLTRPQRAEVDAQRRIADLRSRFEQGIFRVHAYVKEQKIEAPECFISYAWGEPQHERWVERNLATDLQKAGLNVVLDRWESVKIGSSVSRFVERIEKCSAVIVIGTPLYRKKYENKETNTGYVVAAEVDVISNRLLGTEAQKETVLPALLEGDKTSSLPPLLHGRVHADFRHLEKYFATTFDLILSLYRIPPNDRAVADLRESLRATEKDYYTQSESSLGHNQGLCP